MKLDAVQINGYRSASDVSLNDVGTFNVLIGKNNSGKSTILFAINAFFRCIAGGNLVRSNPPLGRLVDFSKGLPADEPIRISLTFSLQLAERDQLIRDIATEAPQVKNATDGLDPSLKLAVTISVSRPPHRWASVESVLLVGDTSASSSRTLLRVGPEATKEIVAKFQASQSGKNLSDEVKRLLDTIDADDFRRMTRETTESRNAMPYFLRRTEASPAVTRLFESSLAASSNFGEFQNNMRAGCDKYLEEAEQAAKTPFKNSVETFSGNQDAIPAYVMNLIHRLDAMRVLYLTEQRAPVGKLEAEKLLSFKVKRGGTESLKNIQETVDGLLGVQVDAFESTAAGEKSAEMDVDNFLLEVNGSGVRESLRLILDVEFQHPAILLVEEPEVHLHPALETSMMRYLKAVSGNSQIFISTHSTNFLDTADMQNVYLVSKEQGQTQAQRVNLEEAESKIPKELGLRLSSLFMFDRLIFVEGPTDEAMIREWASILGHNLSQANVGFIAMGGVRNFTHYATEAILSLLTKRRVKMWFLVDRDERNDTEIKKLEVGLKEKAKIIVLSKREIENYLIVPRALAEFIKLKQELGNVKATALKTDAVFEVVSECAETLKEFAIAKRVAKVVCTPIYARATFQPSDFKGGVGQKLSAELEQLRQGVEAKAAALTKTIHEKTEEVERSWVISKLDIVPGDLLLDCVCQKFGVRFRKDVDSARLAGLMQESEIDLQIKDLLAEIVA